MAAKRSKAELTKEEVSKLLAYDPDTGLFTWKVRTRGRSGQILPGDQAGHAHKDGYRRMCVKGVRCMAHQLAWLMMTGEWPPMHMDHKDRNKANNAWSNLRLATCSQNSFNRDVPLRNTTGYSGVRWDADRRRWKAQIKIDRKEIFLGRFDCFQDALAARKAAEPIYFGDFAAS